MHRLLVRLRQLAKSRRRLMTSPNHGARLHGHTWRVARWTLAFVNQLVPSLVLLGYHEFPALRGLVPRARDLRRRRRHRSSGGEPDIGGTGEGRGVLCRSYGRRCLELRVTDRVWLLADHGPRTCGAAPGQRLRLRRGGQSRPAGTGRQTANRPPQQLAALAAVVQGNSRRRGGGARGRDLVMSAH
jgi:hypothetical protein